jgi:hypothetical protein
VVASELATIKSEASFGESTIVKRHGERAS